MVRCAQTLKSSLSIVSGPSHYDCDNVLVVFFSFSFSETSGTSGDSFVGNKIGLLLLRRRSAGIVPIPAKVCSESEDNNLH